MIVTSSGLRIPETLRRAAAWGSGRVLKAQGPDSRMEASVAFVTASRIRSLNHKFRGKNKVTDVLSFPLDEEIEGRRHAGDVVICLSRAKQQALAMKHPLVREVLLLAVHGTLHLLGFKHHGTSPDPMRKIEKKILAEWKGSLRP